MAKPKVSAPAATGKSGARRARRKPRGALAAICALLVTSALLRLAIGAGEALAKEDTTPRTPDPAHATADPAATRDPAAGAHGADGPRLVAEADLQPLLEALQAREARIRQRESAVDVRMQALAVAEQEIDRKMTELAQAEASLKATLSLARTAAADDIAKLTDVYATMKPKQAAALFEEMDPEFAAGFLGNMRPDAAAAIMAGMTPQSAYLVSVILAGRNADVPKQ